MVSSAHDSIQSHLLTGSHKGDANSQLLLSILAVHDIKVDFEAVAALMGPNCTSRAVQEQLKKLKKLASTKANGASPTAAVAKVSRKATASSVWS